MKYYKEIILTTIFIIAFIGIGFTINSCSNELSKRENSFYARKQARSGYPVTCVILNISNATGGWEGRPACTYIKRLDTQEYAEYNGAWGHPGDTIRTTQGKWEDGYIFR